MDERFDLVYRLLDDQIVDVDGRRCGRVDDVELMGGPGEALELGGLLTGRGAYADRMPARLRGLARRVFGKDIRGLVGEDPDIVFEHPGRQTMGASIFVTKRGGTVVTCAATSGYMVEFDNRHFWMKLKRLIASHFANYDEAWQANRLVAKGMIQPLLSDVVPLESAGEAARSPGSAIAVRMVFSRVGSCSSR